MTTDVHRNDALSRYELLIDGQVVGVADFRLQGDAVVIPHTEIVHHLRGQGLGAILVKGALDDIRHAGRSIVPSCWYVAQFIDEHPEERDLLAA